MTAFSIAIENEDILALKQTVSLADVVRSRGVELRKKGRQLWGLCPFHDEAEPSFAVDERKGLWNCLGKCGEGGDAFSFVMKADGIGFAEAFALLEENSPQRRGDPAGNTTADANGQMFVYDAENKQVSVSNSGGTVGQYAYDGDGRRVKKVVPASGETTVFVYDASGKLVAEYSTIIASPETAKVSYLTNDHLGSPRVVTNGSGSVVSRKDFTAFGEETVTPQRISALGYNPQNIRQDYTGYQKDDESGLEFAQARYYNAGHGRFTSADPLTASASIRDPQTFNRYSYALNSPYKFTDPLGLISSSTGACGQCGKEEFGGGGGGVNPFGGGMFVRFGSYDAPTPEAHTNEAAEPAEATRDLSHETAQTAQPAGDYGYNETTRTLQTTMVDGSNSVDITVTITTRVYFETDGNGGEVVQAGVPPRTEGPFVTVALGNVRGYDAADQGKIESVTKAIVSAALDMNIDARVAIALGIKESRLGTGRQIAGNTAPWKNPEVNPLQLSAACKKCPSRAKAGIANQDYNIKGAVQVYKDLGGSIKAFGGEGVAPSQKGYSAGVRRYYNAISDATSTKGVCLSGSCR